jgi:hypothetical protein
MCRHEEELKEGGLFRKEHSLINFDETKENEKEDFDVRRRKSSSATPVTTMCDGRMLARPPQSLLYEYGASDSSDELVPDTFDKPSVAIDIMPMERNVVDEDDDYSDNDSKVLISAAHGGAMKKNMMKWF